MVVNRPARYPLAPALIRGSSRSLCRSVRRSRGQSRDRNRSRGSRLRCRLGLCRLDLGLAAKVGRQAKGREVRRFSRHACRGPSSGPLHWHRHNLKPPRRHGGTGRFSIRGGPRVSGQTSTTCASSSLASDDSTPNELDADRKGFSSDSQACAGLARSSHDHSAAMTSIGTGYDLSASTYR